MGTQLFSSFIQRRMEASDPHILFFDACMLHAEAHHAQQQQQQLQQQQASEASTPTTDGSCPPPSSSFFPARRPPPRLLVDRVEALGLAASPSRSRLNGSHTGLLGGSPSSLSLLTRSPSILASSSSSSSSYSRLPTFPYDAAASSPAAPTTHGGEEGPASPPRLAGLLHKVSSSISLARLSSLREHEPSELPGVACCSSSSMMGDITAPVAGAGAAEEGRGTRTVGGGGGGYGGAVAVVECRPSTEGLPDGERFSYCDHGFLAWPQRLDDRWVALEVCGVMLVAASPFGFIKTC